MEYNLPYILFVIFFNFEQKLAESRPTRGHIEFSMLQHNVFLILTKLLAKINIAYHGYDSEFEV